MDRRVTLRPDGGRFDAAQRGSCGNVEPMYKHILVGVDGSADSRRAAENALSLASSLGSKVTLLFVLEPPRMVAPFGPMDAFVTTGPRPTEEQMASVDALLDELASGASGTQVEKRLEVGRPADVLCDQAEALGADLVVVGARGHGAVERFFLGSVSDRVVHHSKVPVLVLR